MIDLVTTAPRADTSQNWSSSRPAAAQPDAVSTGFGSVTAATVVRISTISSVSLHGIRPDQILGQLLRHRPTGPGQPRKPVPRRTTARTDCIHQRHGPAGRTSCTPPIPHAIASSTATCAGMPCKPSRVADGLQHRHGSTGVDRSRPDPRDGRRERVRHPPAKAGGAVVGGHDHVTDDAPRHRLSEQPVRGGCADDHHHSAAEGSQPFGRAG